MSHKRRLAALLCAFVLFGVSSQAISHDGLYFVAVENMVLPLTDDAMPFWHNGYLYISCDVFNGNVRDILGISLAKIWDGVLLYRGEQSLLFQREYPYAQDAEQNTYTPGMVWYEDTAYVPAAVVARYFNLLYSTVEVEHGKLVWLRSASFKMGDKAFAKAATFQLNAAYQEYLKPPEPQPEMESAPPEEPETSEETVPEPEAIAWEEPEAASVTPEAVPETPEPAAHVSGESVEAPEISVTPPPSEPEAAAPPTSAQAVTPSTSAQSVTPSTSAQSVTPSPEPVAPVEKPVTSAPDAATPPKAATPSTAAQAATPPEPVAPVEKPVTSAPDAVTPPKAAAPSTPMQAATPSISAQTMTPSPEPVAPAEKPVTPAPDAVTPSMSAQSVTPSISAQSAATDSPPDAATSMRGNQQIYLCLRGNDDTPALLDALDHYDIRATVFCDETFLAEQGDLLRRMTATGYRVGLYVPAGETASILAQLETCNLLLLRTTMEKTRLAFLDGGGEDTLAAVRDAGFFCLRPDLNRVKLPLRTSQQAADLLKLVSKHSKPVSVWLGGTVTRSGLNAFLNDALEIDDTFLPWTETASF